MMEKRAGLAAMRCALAFALGVALPLVMRPPAAGAQHAARDDVFVFHGSGGARHTMALQGGRYVINVYAGFNVAVPAGSMCTFTASLNGIEHPISSGLSNLGSTVVGSYAPYRYIPTLNLPAGHYTLSVSPLTNCPWSVSIGGGGTGHPVVMFAGSGIYHTLAGHNERTTIVETTNKPYTFGFTYNAWGEGFKEPVASLAIVGSGRVLHTYKLRPMFGDYGQTAFGVDLTFPPGRGDKPGSYTARFTMTLGPKQVTKTVAYTVQTLAAGHWAQQQSAGASDLYDLACPAASMCLSVGKNATLIGTNNGGASWTKRSTPFDNTTFLSLNGVSCPTSHTCYAVGDQYFILASTDGGSTWSKQNGDDTFTSYGQNLTAIACPRESHCYAVGTAGVIAATTDGGAHWALQKAFASDKNLNNIACPSVDVCYAVGAAGTIKRTTDGGTTWQRQTTGSDSLFGIDCPTTRVCYAAGEHGTILMTSDGGTTWTRQNNPLNGSHLSLGDLSCSSALTCHVVGEAGTILLTTDGGRSWRDQASPVSTLLNVVTCVRGGPCYAVGQNGVIVKGA